jgi:hypothetical protein
VREDEEANSFCRTFGPEKILPATYPLLDWFVIRNRMELFRLIVFRADCTARPPQSERRPDKQPRRLRQPCRDSPFSGEEHAGSPLGRAGPFRFRPVGPRTERRPRATDRARLGAYAVTSASAKARRYNPAGSPQILLLAATWRRLTREMWR